MFGKRPFDQLNHDAGDRRAVADDELRRRVHDDVGAPFQRPAEIGRRERVVHDQWCSHLLRDRRGRLEVEHVAPGIRDRLREEDLRGRRDSLPPAVRVVHVDPVELDLQLPREMVELRRRAAVERLRDCDVVSRLEQREEERSLRCESACKCDGPDTVLEVRYPLLERGDRRIHDPAVDVPVLLQVEVRRRRLGVLEDEARRLVDGRRAGTGVGIRTLSGVHGTSVESELAALVAHRRSAYRRLRRQSGALWTSGCTHLSERGVRSQRRRPTKRT